MFNINYHVDKDGLLTHICISFQDSPFNRGAILADEVGLEKIHEALLIISEKWFEVYNKILVVVPVHLMAQWIRVLDDNFNIPL